MQEFLEKLQEDQRRMRKFLRSQSLHFKNMGEALADVRHLNGRVFLLAEPPLEGIARLIAEEYLTHLPVIPLDLNHPRPASVLPDASGEVLYGREAAAAQAARHLHPDDMLLGLLNEGGEAATMRVLEGAIERDLRVLLIGSLEARSCKKYADERIFLPTRGVKTVCESMFICTRILARISRGALRERGSDEKLIQAVCERCQEFVFFPERKRGRTGSCPFCEQPIRIPKDADRRTHPPVVEVEGVGSGSAGTSGRRPRRGSDRAEQQSERGGSSRNQKAKSGKQRRTSRTKTDVLKKERPAGGRSKSGRRRRLKPSVLEYKVPSPEALEDSDALTPASHLGADSAQEPRGLVSEEAPQARAPSEDTSIPLSSEEISQIQGTRRRRRRGAESDSEDVEEPAGGFVLEPESGSQITPQLAADAEDLADAEWDEDDDLDDEVEEDLDDLDDSDLDDSDLDAEDLDESDLDAEDDSEALGDVLEDDLDDSDLDDSDLDDSDLGESDLGESDLAEESLEELDPQTARKLLSQQATDEPEGEYEDFDDLDSDVEDDLDDSDLDGSDLDGAGLDEDDSLEAELAREGAPSVEGGKVAEAEPDPFAEEDAFIADLEVPRRAELDSASRDDSVETAGLGSSRKLSAHYTVSDCVLRWGRGGFPDEGSPANALRSMTKDGLIFEVDSDDEAASTLQKGDELYMRIEIPAFIEPILVRAEVVELRGTSGGGRGTRAQVEFRKVDDAVQRKLVRAAENTAAPA